MALGVNAQAIQALKNLRSRVLELHEDLEKGTQQLRSVFDENEKGLGSHSDSIRSLLEELESSGSSAGKPVKKLARRLVLSAEVRQASMDTDAYRSKSR